MICSAVRGLRLAGMLLLVVLAAVFAAAVASDCSPWSADEAGSWVGGCRSVADALRGAYRIDGASAAANTSISPAPWVARGSPVADGIELRILPLGDSITFGWLSTDGNGYRLRLQQDLKADKVVFAGDVESGSMADNWMAAWPGQTLGYIMENMESSLEQNPNVILLHGGTNDLLLEGTDPTVAANTLEKCMDRIIAELPGAVLMVAQIIGVNDTVGHQERIDAFNAKVPELVQSRYDAGHKVQMVDFRSIGWAYLRPQDVHPTDQGYLAMADIWYNAMRGIPSGWVTAPAGIDPVRPYRKTVDVSGASRTTTLRVLNLVLVSILTWTFWHFV